MRYRHDHSPSDLALWTLSLGIEPLAAALNAVETVKPTAGHRIAVLGPRYLGMFVIAGSECIKAGVRSLA